jgi:hypothetical protein
MSDINTLRPASDFKEIAFPQCARNCAAVNHLGAGECENVCRFKFREVKNKPYLYENLSQRELDLYHRNPPNSLLGGSAPSYSAPEQPIAEPNTGTVAPENFQHLTGKIR